MTDLLDIAFWVGPALVVATLIVRSEIRLRRRRREAQRQGGC
ncbi:MAG TPA: hypothetical protein VFQ42_04220 [Mycobacterium sp.]|nr:hypothetical protein [Mycobacterium sp.]